MRGLGEPELYSFWPSGGKRVLGTPIYVWVLRGYVGVIVFMSFSVISARMISDGNELELGPNHAFPLADIFHR